MAEIAGYGGDFQYNAAIASPQSNASTTLKGINNWTISYTADTHEITDFSDAGVKAYLGGLSGWTGTIAGLYDSADATVYNSTIAPGNDIACRFETSAASKDMTGVGLITGMSFTTGIDGAVTTNISIQGTGGLVIRG